MSKLCVWTKLIAYVKASFGVLSTQRAWTEKIPVFSSPEGHPKVFFLPEVKKLKLTALQKFYNASGEKESSRNDYVTVQQFSRQYGVVYFV